MEMSFVMVATAEVLIDEFVEALNNEREMDRLMECVK